jgi:hypothetical protein
MKRPAVSRRSRIDWDQPGRSSERKNAPIGVTGGLG